MECVNSNESESILPEVEELQPEVEFHPDQLSNLVDIQEELERLEANVEEVMSIDDVNIVDHEVTIVADQSIEHAILPEMIEGHSQEPMDQEEVSTEHLLSHNEAVAESLEVGETVTIDVPSELEEVVLNTLDTSRNHVPIRPTALPPVTVQLPQVTGPQLKAIRPLPVPEALVTKNSPFLTVAQPKKNVMTRVIFSANSEAAPDAPIIFGEAGGQAIRIIGQNKTLFSNAPKTITIAQAKEMGLKVHHINQGKGIMKKGVVMGGNNRLTMVRSSPTKILPLPIAPSPSLAGPPHKVFIRQGGTIKAGTISGTIIQGTQSHILQVPVSQDNSAQVHQLQLPGKQVQFVRLVSATPGVSSNPSQLNMLSTPVSSPPVSNSFERVMVSPGLSQLSRVQDAKAANNVVMVPAEFVKQYKPTPVTESMSPPLPASALPPPPPSLPKLGVTKMISSHVSKAKDISSTKDVTINPKSKSVDAPNGIRPRKPCNCTKSQCLKLYCDCFANGEFCYKCNCICCFNNLNHEEERQRAIKACLERNPAAFRPKIGKSYIGDERRHNKGCNCRRSGCLKNYCECYEAKIPCSNNCKCIGCRNVEDSKEPRSSDGSKLSQQMAVKNKLSSELLESAHKPLPFTRQPFNLMTQEVVEATCQCLLAQVEGEGKLTDSVERMIVEEFGRCLVEIIDCAARTSMSGSGT